MITAIHSLASIPLVKTLEFLDNLVTNSNISQKIKYKLHSLFSKSEILIKNASPSLFTAPLIWVMNYEVWMGKSLPSHEKIFLQYTAITSAQVLAKFIMKSDIDEGRAFDISDFTESVIQDCVCAAAAYIGANASAMI